MIKKITIHQNLVFCDICGEDTGYDSEQDYAKRKKHFCSNHGHEERLYDNLLEYGEEIANLFYEVAKKQFEIEKGAKK